MVLIVLFLGELISCHRQTLYGTNQTGSVEIAMPLCSSSLSDAVREVHKYSGPEPMHDAKVNPNVYDHIHMKLFRAQRNLYISGFSLFLWLLVSVPPVLFRIRPTMGA